MSVTVHSAQLNGLEAESIRVEIDITPGLYLFSLVGLADKEVQESRERISAAIKNIGALAPHKKAQRVIVNLAPADFKKEGPAFDVPIALGYLLASGQAGFDPRKRMFIGELGLDGGVRPVRGALSIATLAKENGFEELYVPRGNGAEAAFVHDIDVYEIATLDECLNHLEDRVRLSPYAKTGLPESLPQYELDFFDVKGQEAAKRALEIAAAGGHNILFYGPPGTGKTMLAKTLPTILPPLSLQEAIEVTKVYSAAGLTRESGSIFSLRPYRAPHHTSSAAAIIGGGSVPRPGEISLAHRGVLFLDEFPEFQRPVLEALREPLEERSVTVSRMQATMKYPADFILVASMNPCPCGNQGNNTQLCICTPAAIQKYQRKISGPLSDRIDLHVHVPNVSYEKLEAAESGEPSEHIRERVTAARKLQVARYLHDSILKNSEMNVRQVKQYAMPDEEGKGILQKAVDKYALSARSYHRILKLSRTIADLANEASIKASHILEALRYRPTREV